MREGIIPHCFANGVRAFISGHEHNFQCIDSEDTDANRRVHCVVTGGAGTFRTGKPAGSTTGHRQSWGGNQGMHFLIVTIAGSSMTIEPIAADGKALPLFNREGGTVAGPIVVKR